MKKIHPIIILLALLIGIYSCRKGDVGPQGPQGPEGAPGIAGVGGTMIYSGADVPGTTIGKDGDFYLRLPSGHMYGPKKDGLWGDPTNLKGNDGVNGTNGSNGATGATGAAGTPGTKILSGTVLPDASLGAIGDFYFKTDQTLLFGPKTAAGWGTSINLRGTANVIYSGWQTAVRVRDSIMDGTNIRIAHIYAPRITDAVQNSGAVLMYMDYGGGVFPLPYTSNAGGRISTISFKLKTREIVVYRMIYDGGALLNLGNQIVYRYVIIPGGVIARLKNHNVDFNNPFALDRAINELKLSDPNLFLSH